MSTAKLDVAVVVVVIVFVVVVVVVSMGSVNLSQPLYKESIFANFV